MVGTLGVGQFKGGVKLDAHLIAKNGFVERRYVVVRGDIDLFVDDFGSAGAGDSDVEIFFGGEIFPEEIFGYSCVSI